MLGALVGVASAPALPFSGVTRLVASRSPRNRQASSFARERTSSGRSRESGNALFRKTTSNERVVDNFGEPPAAAMFADEIRRNSVFGARLDKRNQNGLQGIAASLLIFTPPVACHWSSRQLRRGCEAAWPRSLGALRALGVHGTGAVTQRLFARPAMPIETPRPPGAAAPRGAARRPWSRRNRCRWITVNEPWVISWLGYGTGEHAPGTRDERAALAAGHHALLAHGLATEVLRGVAPQAQVGLMIDLVYFEPLTDSEADREAVRRFDGSRNRWFLDPVLRGRTRDVLDDFAPLAPPVANGDLQAIAAPIDFLGINWSSTSCTPDVSDVLQPGAIYRSSLDHRSPGPDPRLSVHLCGHVTIDVGLEPRRRRTRLQMPCHVRARARISSSFSRTNRPSCVDGPTGSAVVRRDWFRPRLLSRGQLRL